MSKRDEWLEAWVVRIFGNWANYRASLPSRCWVEGLYGWSSRPR